MIMGNKRANKLELLNPVVNVQKAKRSLSVP